MGKKEITHEITAAFITQHCLNLIQVLEFIKTECIINVYLRNERGIIQIIKRAGQCYACQLEMVSLHVLPRVTRIEFQNEVQCVNI